MRPPGRDCSGSRPARCRACSTAETQAAPGVPAQDGGVEPALGRGPAAWRQSAGERATRGDGRAARYNAGRAARAAAEIASEAAPPAV